MIGKEGEEKVLGKLLNARVPNREALYQLSGKALVGALEPDKLLGGNSPYTKKPQAEKMEPQLQKAAEKNVEQQKKNRTAGL